jgi:hypothetical protein
MHSEMILNPLSTIHCAPGTVSIVTKQRACLTSLESRSKRARLEPNPEESALMGTISDDHQHTAHVLAGSHNTEAVVFMFA